MTELFFDDTKAEITEDGFYHLKFRTPRDILSFVWLGEGTATGTIVFHYFDNYGDEPVEVDLSEPSQNILKLRAALPEIHLDVEGLSENGILLLYASKA
jgi:hypothetical protein